MVGKFAREVGGDELQPRDRLLEAVRMVPRVVLAAIWIFFLMPA